MKTEIFSDAILNRNRVRFYYGHDQITLEPYFVSQDIEGNKFIYGKTHCSKPITKFEYRRIANIKILKEDKFNPTIPLELFIN